MTPILQDLHWLQSSAVHVSIVPAYLPDKNKRLQPSRSLHSCDGYKAIVPQVYKVGLGDRAFSIVGPKLWNSLSITIWSEPSISIFKSLLKTYLFRLAYQEQKK